MHRKCTNPEISTYPEDTSAASTAWSSAYVARIENADVYFNSFITFKRTYYCQKALRLLIWSSVSML